MPTNCRMTTNPSGWLFCHVYNRFSLVVDDSTAFGPSQCTRNKRTRNAKKTEALIYTSNKSSDRYSRLMLRTSSFHAVMWHTMEQGVLSRWRFIFARPFRRTVAQAGMSLDGMYVRSLQHRAPAESEIHFVDRRPSLRLTITSCLRRSFRSPVAAAAAAAATGAAASDALGTRCPAKVCGRKQLHPLVPPTTTVVIVVVVVVVAPTVRPGTNSAAQLSIIIMAASDRSCRRFMCERRLVPTADYSEPSSYCGCLSDDGGGRCNVTLSRRRAGKGGTGGRRQSRPRSRKEVR